MQDALTESFCERCGTRFEFAAPSRITPIRRTRGLVTGLKNYIMSQDSLSDSVGDAMRSQSDALASKQLDAFHASFNFCIDCRQYTCTNCWNDAKGRCQSCQPLSEAEGRAKRFAATLGQPLPEVGTPFEFVPAAPNANVDWPAMDLTEPEPGPLPLIAWEEPVAESGPVFVEPEPQPVLVEAEVEPEPILVEAEPEPERESWLVEPEPVLVEAEVEPEPVAEPQPEPVLVAPEPEPYRPLGPISDTFLHFPGSIPERQEIPAAVARTEPELDTGADIETLAARRAQLDLLGLGDPGEGPVGPARPNVIPYRSSGAAPRDAERLAAIAGRSFWDASAREVSGAITEIGVRSCGHCELSISATARFCRRCGTPQAQSA